MEVNSIHLLQDKSIRGYIKSLCFLRHNKIARLSYTLKISNCSWTFDKLPTVLPSGIYYTVGFHRYESKIKYLNSGEFRKQHLEITFERPRMSLLR